MPTSRIAIISQHEVETEVSARSAAGPSGLTVGATAVFVPQIQASVEVVADVDFGTAPFSHVSVPDEPETLESIFLPEVIDRACQSFAKF